MATKERVAKFIGRKDWSDLSSFFVPWLGLAIKRNVRDFLGRKLRIEHLQVVIVVAFVVLSLQKFHQFFAPVRTSYRTVLGIQVLRSVFPPCTGPSSSDYPPSHYLCLFCKRLCQTPYSKRMDMRISSVRYKSCMQA